MYILVNECERYSMGRGKGNVKRARLVEPRSVDEVIERHACVRCD